MICIILTAGTSENNVYYKKRLLTLIFRTVTIVLVCDLIAKVFAKSRVQRALCAHTHENAGVYRACAVVCAVQHSF